MVLSGHRHVPYVWSISGVRIVHSGTASSMRVRGTMPPSYNVIDFDEESVRITLKQPGKGKEGEDPLASFSRTPVTTSEFYPDFDRFVLYDRLPFLRLDIDSSPPASAGGEEGGPKR
jgi:Icc protein